MKKIRLALNFKQQSKKDKIMQNIFQKIQKGSTLLLAMVIISTVLFAGIGVATILSRQIKEIPSIKSEAAAFYISETIADMIRENGIEGANCDSLNFENMNVECSAEEIDEKYYIKIKIDNNYYKFVIEKNENGGGGSEESVVKIYFQNPGWANPKIQYMLGTGIRIYKDAEVSSYNGWLVGVATVEELGGTGDIYIRICPGESDSGCKDTTDWRKIEKIKTPICRFSCSQDYCNIPCVNPDTISVYFKKPIGWGEIITSTYYVWPNYINKIMNESSYVGWMESYINLNGIGINDQWTIIYFCEGEKGVGEKCGGTGFPSDWMRGGIMCVDGSTSTRCFFPGSNY
jgi:hypothetical protein